MAESVLQSKRSLVALAMGLALLVSVGAAWLLIQGPRRRVAAAKDFLAELRTDGLAKHWPERVRTQWWLRYDADNKPLGWQVDVRGRGDDGGYLATNLMITGGRYQWVEWSLNANATAGVYEARSRMLNQRPGAPDTLISLREGVVKVHPSGPPIRHLAESAAPANYLPEGLWGLAVRHVARLGGVAQFEAVFDDSPNYKDGGPVEFVATRLESLGEGQASDGSSIRRVQLSATIRLVLAGQIVTRPVSWEYRVATSGEIVEIVYADGKRMIRTSEAEVEASDAHSARELVEGFLPPKLRELWDAEGGGDSGKGAEDAGDGDDVDKVRVRLGTIRGVPLT